MIRFAILANLVLLVFIIGFLLFILQYRRRKRWYEKEKVLIQEQHRVELLDTQLEIQTRTMRHIGREIHDSVGQKLTLASLYVSQVAQQTEGGATSEKITSIGQLINGSLEELRTLSRSLTGPASTPAMLTALLEAECKYVNASGVCAAVLESNERPGAFTPAVTNHLYRILQEFIQNSLKHAACKRITIRLHITPGDWIVEAADDGKGFDPALPATGIGLNNMKQRAAQAEAVCLLSSEPGKGTRLLVQGTT